AALLVFETIKDVPDRSVAARAMLYAGYCQEKLARPQVWKRYALVLREFPDQPDVVALARKRLRSLGRPTDPGIRPPVPRPRARLVRTMPIPIADFYQADAIALAPDSATLYLLSRQTGYLAVLSLPSGKMTHAIPLASALLTSALAASPDRSRIYTADESGDVIEIDTHTNGVNKIHVGGKIVAIEITPDGRWLYFATRCSEPTTFTTGLKRL